MYLFVFTQTEVHLYTSVVLSDYCIVFLYTKTPPSLYPCLYDWTQGLLCFVTINEAAAIIPCASACTRAQCWHLNGQPWHGHMFSILLGLTHCLLRWTAYTPASRARKVSCQALMSTWYCRLFKCCQAERLGMRPHCCLNVHFLDYWG